MRRIPWLPAAMVSPGPGLPGKAARRFGRVAIGLIVAGGFVSPTSIARAQYVVGPALYTLPDARNNALGGAGVADISDPSTVWNNPANAGALRGVNILPFYGEILSSRSNEYNFSGIALNGGYPVYSRGSIGVSLGGELRYSRFSYPGDTREEVWALAGAADVQIAGNYHVALGGTWKSVSADHGESLTYFQGEEATAYDLGVRLSGDFETGEGWRFVPGLGYSRRNAGDGESQFSNGGPAPFELQPTRVYGLSFAAVSPTQLLFGNDVPVAAFQLNIDVEDIEGENSEGHLINALEVALWQVAFFRIGTAVPDDKTARARQSYTIGFGLGASLRHVRFRLDYSAVPLSISGVDDVDRDHKASILVSWVP